MSGHLDRDDDGLGPVVDDPDDPELRVALARTRADLAAHAAATPPMPPSLLAAIDRTLARERAGHAAGNTPSEVVHHRVPRARWLVAAVVLVLAAIGVGAVASGTVPEGGAGAPAPVVAGPLDPGLADVPVLRRGDGPAALRAGLGRAEFGPLTDPGRLAGCLAAHGVAPGTRPVGARRVVVDGSPGVLLVLPTGVAARFRLLVVGDGCAAVTPLTVSDTVVGR